MELLCEVIGITCPVGMQFESSIYSTHTCYNVLLLPKGELGNLILITLKVSVGIKVQFFGIVQK